MTYCVAIRVDEGLCFISDSRTNAGVDNVSTYSKMYSFGEPDARQLVILSAGNLATDARCHRSHQARSESRSSPKHPFVANHRRSC